MPFSATVPWLLHCGGGRGRGDHDNEHDNCSERRCQPAHGSRSSHFAAAHSRAPYARKQGSSPQRACHLGGDLRRFGAGPSHRVRRVSTQGALHRLVLTAHQLALHIGNGIWQPIPAVRDGCYAYRRARDSALGLSALQASRPNGTTPWTPLPAGFFRVRTSRRQPWVAARTPCPSRVVLGRPGSPGPGRAGPFDIRVKGREAEGHVGSSAARKRVTPTLGFPGRRGWACDLLM